MLYNGDIAKWKKFGYSLLLRAGMHLSEVDEATAKSAVAAAFAGGVILVNADNAVVRHDGNNVNLTANVLNSTEAANFYLANPFVDALQDNNDPRLPAIAIRYVGASSGAGQMPRLEQLPPVINMDYLWVVPMAKQIFPERRCLVEGKGMPIANWIVAVW